MSPLTCFLFLVIIVLIIGVFYFFMTKYNENVNHLQHIQQMFTHNHSDQSQKNSVLDKMLSYLYDQQNQSSQKEVVYTNYNSPYYPQSLLPDPYYLSGCSYRYPWYGGYGNGYGNGYGYGNANDNSAIQVKVNNNIQQPQPQKIETKTNKPSSPRRFAPQRKLTPTRKSTMSK